MRCRVGACSNRPRQRIFRTAGASPCPTMTLDITPLNPNLPHTPYYQRKIGDFSTIIIHYSSFIIHLIKITPLNQNLTAVTPLFYSQCNKKMPSALFYTHYNIIFAYHTSYRQGLQIPEVSGFRPVLTE